ncbi:MAG: hypothetical protein ACR2RE_29205 [Geminicoccaceae bacterium]
MIEHTCHAIGCEKAVPPKMFMCKYHWFMLPKSLRNEIWKAYRPGQEIDKTPSEDYLMAAKEAIIWLSKKESCHD